MKLNKKICKMILLNKDKYEKLLIQKAQQYLDVGAIATNFNRN